ncbi:TAT-variant-translocated molybdopterin oxidoreductase [Flavicella sediminum]|uniref:TAT-variant-translocated molybdopterin oxidoreductase n=1 Tax=Flavicella sediminum TaxID=2585141 RepID=UPI0011221F71|nr:TAT-variant-translocated molybdopterin oxidoreductase [Flavicella sediminum]
MASNRKYWKSVEELNENSSIVAKLEENEFVSDIATDEFLGDKETLEESSTSRRDFLKYVGFSTAAASLAACEGPVRKSIPYVIKPEEITPGIANYYASTIADGYDFANVLVKTREGRPILIKPNKLANGSTNARVQASVLSLYDSLRLTGPKVNGNAISWSDANGQIKATLAELKNKGEKVVVLTGTLASPSTEKLIANFAAANGNVQHVQYDALSESATLDAFQEVYGTRALPNYDFSDASVIVSIGADFLGDWQGGGFEKSYTAGRQVATGKMSRHIQIESNMSLTGSNADKRIVLKPSEQIFALINLYNAVTGENLPSKATPKDADIKNAAKQLKKAGSKAVVVTGIQDKNAQLIALALNNALASSVMDTAAVKYTRQGNDADVQQLIADMKAGKVGAVISYGANPVYTLANSADFVAGLKKVKLSVAFASSEDETASVAQYALPTPHYLEAWGDVQISAGSYSLTQPTINPLFDTKQFQDCLLDWSGSSEAYYDFLKNSWASDVLNGTSWNQALHDGLFTTKVEELAAKSIDVAAAASALKAETKGGAFELTLFASTAIGDGQQANNPWLQELPDPLTRAAWDNYLTISQADATALGFSNPIQDNGAINGDYANVTVGGTILENVPVLIQPGQAKGSFGLAVGYGKTKAMKSEMQVGVNAYTLAKGLKLVQVASVEKVGGTHKFACEQLQHTIAGRYEILKETSLTSYNDSSLDPKESWNQVTKVSLKHEEVSVNDVDLWDDQDRSIGHHFNLSIDLSDCTGCGACVVACHAENNVPVVGKHEVRVGRDMHWLRIDRYYSSELDATSEERTENVNTTSDSVSDYYNLEVPAENPQVAFQPVMCQHCNHAPCETVCPVAATSHGRQGQNQMAYNRCVGTRYCANNCPYRVRRFNWFKYNENSEFDFNMNDDYGKMVLNPDVVVRSRGVMEKCSFCIQATQQVILNAKKDGRKVAPGEFNDAVACSSACTTGALVFGDVNEEKDEIVEKKADKRMYRLLEAIGTDNNVLYQVKVRNTEEA